jgi:hypothetical protein
LAFMEEKRKRTEARRIEIEIGILKARAELVPKDLAVRQASFLLISLRSALLSIPGRISRDLEGKNAAAIEAALGTEIRRALNEIKDLPLRVGDKNWMQRIK